MDVTRVGRVLLEAGVLVSADEAGLLARHAELVQIANERLNLTRITTDDGMLALHIVDSLAFLPLTGPLTGTVIDVGSGAGYPGIPLAVIGCDVVMCESVQKKAVFLRECLEELGVNAVVEGVRAEELALRAPAIADVVVARAVSALASLVELASPLLRNGGRLIALKGPGSSAEAAAGRSAAGRCGMVEESETAYTLPSGEARTVVVYRRQGEAAIQLPRRPGMAQKHPLG